MNRTTLIALSISCLASVYVSAEPEISYNRDIRPILGDLCFSCHGPDSGSRKADLRLDVEELAKAPLGGNGPTPIVPGDLEMSEVVYRMITDDPDELMPPPKSKTPMTQEQIDLISKWIEQGAKYEKHWSYVTPQAPGVAVETTREKIDHYVGKKLEEQGLDSSPQADPAHLLRRVSFDLTGLPPTLAELDTYLADPSPAAYGAAVDRLLDSTAYGERMALEWLDVARYGDTDGLFEDHHRSVYPWRDWVVRAFNENLPYSDFISWQVAGDLYPDASVDQKLATGFLRNNVTSNEGGIIDEDYRVKYVVDRTNTTATAFLGLTLECAQCHDHKYDPMSQKEYFEFSGFFNSLVGRGNTKGATDPLIKMHTPENEARLAAIGQELEQIGQQVQQTPPELLADFEKWKPTLERPVDWQRRHTAAEVEKTVAASEYPQSQTVGRYIRVSLAEKGFITMSEVEVYSQGANIAAGGQATQSSNYGKNTAQRAIDGNKDGTFASCSSTSGGDTPWWELDLGAEYGIDHIVIYNRDDCCPERLDHARVEILGADRQPVGERSLVDAPFRSAFAINEKAPEPEDDSKPQSTDIKTTDSISAIQFSGDGIGAIAKLKLEIHGNGRPRTVAIVPESDLTLRPDKPAVAGLVEPLTLTDKETLKVSYQGIPCTIDTCADPAVALKAKFIKKPESMLAYYQTIWQGYESQRQQRAKLQEEKEGIEKQVTISMIAQDMDKMRPTYLLERGEYDKRGEEVQPRALNSIFAYTEKYPPNRMGLAQWLTDEQNPLTARVAVNRYWQMLFGTGLVKTSEDFGSQGERPTHPELLDALATDFIASGWDVKGLLRSIVTSQTYQQSSRRVSQEDSDPENRYLARGVRRRLQAEFLRDQALSISGLLDRKMGGPGVNPYQPAVLFGRNAIGNASFKQGTGEELYRRSLYTFWKRQVPAANMRILGADGRTVCRTRRESTNTPLQAFVMLNDPQFVEAARFLAERMMKEGGAAAEDRIDYGFRLATSRHASEQELAILAAEYSDRHAEFSADAERAKAYLNGGGDKAIDAELPVAEAAAYAAVASLIINLDEALSRN